MKRPIFVLALGYVIGIIMGLYTKVSIVLFYAIFLLIYYIKFLIKDKNIKNKFKLFSFRRYSRYIKIYISKEAIFLFIIASIISNINIKKEKIKYDEYFSEGERIRAIAIVEKEISSNEFITTYEIKLKKILILEGEKKEKNNYENFKLYMKIKNNKNKTIKLGDVIDVDGIFLEPAGRRNYKGFSYKDYLKTQKVYGIINVENISKTGEKKNTVFEEKIKNIKIGINEILYKNLPKQYANVVKGILIGDTKDINKEIKEKFRIVNISHVLAVSGMHVAYLMLTISFIFEKIIGKRKTYFLKIFVLIIYIFLTEGSPSILRAGITGILIITSKFIYRRFDNVVALSLIALISLVYNPYTILNIGFQLSYLAVISILMFSKLLKNMLEMLEKKLEKKIEKKGKNKVYKIYRIIQESFIVKKIKDIIIITISVQLLVLPLVIYNTNIVSPYILITNLMAGIIIGPIILISIILICFDIIFLGKIKFKIISELLMVLVKILLGISDFSNLAFSKIYIPTPKIYQMLIYYIIILFLYSMYKVNIQYSNKMTSKRIKNIISAIKYKIYFKNKYKIDKLKFLMILVILISIFNLVENKLKGLKIYFIDVGQGDCTFVVTPKNQTILIDGGGNRNFDVGKNILLPYILDRGFNRVDYIFVSHFDTDHVKGLLTIMEELRIKKVFISKQVEDSKNYREFISILEKKHIKCEILRKNQKIVIEKGIELEVIWPNREEKEMLSINKPLNNNSLVLKMKHKDFSMLFTGDIEKEAEEEIYKDYEEKGIMLKSDILKVAHHGSKTSTIEKLLDKINPKICVIGVGKDNLFGHPSKECLEKFRKRGIKVYRTDLNGEVEIYVKDKSNIRIKSIY